MAGDTLQKFKTSFNRGVTAINLRTSSSLEKAKIKTYIDSLTTETERLVANAGEQAYSIWASGETDFSPLNEQFSAIKQRRDKIEQLQTEYQSIDERDNQILGTSAAEASASPAAPAEQSAGVVCPGCGAVFASPAKFCRKCGQRLQA